MDLFSRHFPAMINDAAKEVTVLFSAKLSSFGSLGNTAAGSYRSCRFFATCSRNSLSLVNYFFPFGNLWRFAVKWRGWFVELLFVSVDEISDIGWDRDLNRIVSGRCVLWGI